jgi:glucosamine--fructose-6-phosphate aminotransferase (isomerizing)
MCGIFGILNSIEKNNIYKIIIDGLIQLQNRGYDSSGICVLKDNNLEIHKYASTNNTSSIEKLLNLGLIEKYENEINKVNNEINNQINKSQIGIGHNRWATHGAKTDINAHPHISNCSNFVLVHNGIIENYQELKKMLIEKCGYTFYSQTDTEVIVNLISYNYKLLNNTFDAIKKTINELEGTYGIIIINKNENNRLYCVRNGSPLLIGYNDDQAIITSEQSGFCNLISTYITLNNDDICIIEYNKDLEKTEIQTKHNYIHKNITLANYDLTPYPYKHWTIKEIYEQPNIIHNVINRGGRIKNDCEVKLGGLEHYQEKLKKVENIVILGCGTSYHAGLYGIYYLKSLCNFNTIQIFDGADFNISDLPRNGKTAIILISQSGETRDLHRCIDIAKENNILTIGIINVVDSLIAREVDCGIYCNAGREMGVASTKAFTSQVICLSLMSVWFAQLHNINEIKRSKIIKDLRNLSNDFKNTIENIDSIIKNDTSKYLSNYNNMFLLGKGSDESIAREGSLKIKEVSYIHSEAYSSSSLKHGPFALLDDNFPVIIINCHEEHSVKVINCFEEVHSRNSPIIFITNNDNIKLNKNCKILNVIKNNSYASLLAIIPLQLLAYHLSIDKNINPDIPKNLAKVVTVE